jgi:hypothetical protein
MGGTAIARKTTLTPSRIEIIIDPTATPSLKPNQKIELKLYVFISINYLNDILRSLLYTLQSQPGYYQ